MTRKLPFLALAGALLLPAPAVSQAQEEELLPPEAEAAIFQRAIREIAERHREQYSLETLWEKTLDALVQPGPDSLLAFNDSEVEAFARLRTESPRNLERIFGQTLAQTADSRPDAFSESDLWVKAMNGLIRSLDDPYAEIFTPEEVEVFEEDNTGNYTGIGIQITQLNDQVTVTAVFRSTPAEQAGILVGDIIVGVNDDDASDWTTGEVSDKVRGPVGTQVSVTVKREGSRNIPFVLTRDEVHVSVVQSAILEDNIGYVSVDRVARSSAQELDVEFRTKLGGTDGIILDLRQNPGGYLDEALMMADVFLQPGQRLASLRSRDPGSVGGESSESWTARARARVPDKPIVVLVDEFSASAAEIVAGALQDYDRALVIGDRSFGKGVVQTVLPLPYNHRLRLTTGTWHTPLGRALHRPRDVRGRPLDESLDTFPTITTPAGRELYATGGVFPDLAIPDDTLKVAERELLRLSGEAEVPLGIRIQEFAFDRAQALRAVGQDPQLSADELDGFVSQLIEEGVPAEAFDDVVARDYLGWRTRFTIAERMDEPAAAIVFRMERDPQLSEALRLLGSSSTQAALFTAADEVAQEIRASANGTSGAPTR